MQTAVIPIATYQMEYYCGLSVRREEEKKFLALLSVDPADVVVCDGSQALRSLVIFL